MILEKHLIFCEDGISSAPITNITGVYDECIGCFKQSKSVIRLVGKVFVRIVPLLKRLVLL